MNLCERKGAPFVMNANYEFGEIASQASFRKCERAELFKQRLDTRCNLR